jgi:copper homeostasis protein
MGRVLLEICLEDIAGAAQAERGGADRIELCTDLAQGGTTPSIGTVSAVLKSVTTVGVQVLVRQRPGDFVYCPGEVEAMVTDIEMISALAPPAGVTVGFVIGALTRDARVDRAVMGRLLKASGGAPVTFHRAFDEVADQRAALETLIDLGVAHVLTSGGQVTASAGVADLADLVDQAGERISVLAAGHVRAHNVAEIVRHSGVSEVHLRAHASSQPTSTSAAVVRAVAAALATGSPPEPEPEPEPVPAAEESLDRRTGMDRRAFL